MKERAQQGYDKNFMYANIETLQSMGSGRPLKRRIDLPDEIEVYGYGGQKNNIWEFQKNQMRKHIASDHKNYYTFSKDYNSGAFPVVNENEVAWEEKKQSEGRWRSKNGFDTLNKRQNWNELPKKVPESVAANLAIPYIQQIAEMKTGLKPKPFNADDPSKVDFHSAVKTSPTFSDKSYFNTVFISGEDMVKEM